MSQTESVSKWSDHMQARFRAAFDGWGISIRTCADRLTNLGPFTVSKDRVHRVLAGHFPGDEYVDAFVGMVWIYEARDWTSLWEVRGTECVVQDIDDIDVPRSLVNRAAEQPLLGELQEELVRRWLVCLQPREQLSDHQMESFRFLAKVLRLGL